MPIGLRCMRPKYSSSGAETGADGVLVAASADGTAVDREKTAQSVRAVHAAEEAVGRMPRISANRRTCSRGEPGDVVG